VGLVSGPVAVSVPQGMAGHDVRRRYVTERRHHKEHAEGMACVSQMDVNAMLGGLMRNAKFRRVVV